MRRHVTIDVYDASPAEFAGELAPDIVDPADEIDPVAYVRGLPVGSSHRLVNALAFVENEVSDFRRFRPMDRTVIVRVAGDLRKAADRLEQATSNRPAPGTSKERRGQRRPRREK